MNQEQTPKQQAIELIRQAEKILLVGSRELNNDQLAALYSMQKVLAKSGKQAQAVVSDTMPKIANLLDTKAVSRSVDGVRDFVLTLDTTGVEVDSLKYHNEDGALKITITPHSGNFSDKDVKIGYGAFQFDLVIAIGVSSFDKTDRMIDDNPTIFDDLHVINIDCHRNNTNWGSVNVVDAMASSISEMLVSILDSIEQGSVDTEIATALLAGIMAATNRFSARNTTPKSMTVAAQLLAAGARQQDIVKALFEHGNGSGERKHTETEKRDDSGQNVKKKYSQDVKVSESKQNQQNLELLRERLASLSEKNTSTTSTQPKAQDPSKDDSTSEELNNPVTQSEPSKSAEHNSEQPAPATAEAS